MWTPIKIKQAEDELGLAEKHNLKGGQSPDRHSLKFRV